MELEDIKNRLNRLEDIVINNNNRDVLFLNIQNIRDFIEIVSTAPTAPPSNFYDQVKIFNDGTNKKIYFYDNKNRLWLSATLT